MFFEGFSERIGAIEQSKLDNLLDALAGVDFGDSKFDRVEFCFKPAGRLMLPVTGAKVWQREYYEPVKPIIEHVEALGCPHLAGRVPYRVEISTMLPTSRIKWHHDSFLFHKLSEKVHVPIITNDQTTFFSKWFQGPEVYMHQMTAGTVYRFNNRVQHSVTNAAPKHRIHVTIDYIEPKWLKVYTFDQFRTHTPVLNTDPEYAFSRQVDMPYRLDLDAEVRSEQGNAYKAWEA